MSRVRPGGAVVRAPLPIASSPGPHLPDGVTVEHLDLRAAAHATSFWLDCTDDELATRRANDPHVREGAHRLASAHPAPTTYDVVLLQHILPSGVEAEKRITMGAHFSPTRRNISQRVRSDL